MAIFEFTKFIKERKPIVRMTWLVKGTAWPPGQQDAPLQPLRTLWSLSGARAQVCLAGTRQGLPVSKGPSTNAMRLWAFISGFKVPRAPPVRPWNPVGVGFGLNAGVRTGASEPAGVASRASKPAVACF